jgi:hypothetical protein
VGAAPARGPALRINRFLLALCVPVPLVAAGTTGYQQLDQLEAMAGP